MTAVGGRAAVGTPLPPVRVDVLGPLRVTVGDDGVEVAGPKRRALLALLTMAEGRAVPTGDLLDALWPDDLPDSARATLQSHVSRLRAHLGPAASRLEGLSGAYRLRLDEGCDTDVARARSLLAAARAASPADAHRALAEARALWRGVALAEFGDVAPLAAAAVTLEGLRKAVDEAYAVAALDAGASDAAVGVASELVAEDPLSESAVVLLMSTLDGTGRAADALRAGYEFRRRLADEAGLDPSPALGELEREIAGRTSTPPSPLRRSTGGLRGRETELAAVERLLGRERLVTVLGPGGVGKTGLATELAARAERPTVLLLAPVTDPAAIPRALADALDLHVVQGDVLRACAALLAAGPQFLLVDNCEHLLASAREVVATLLDGCPRLTVLATSREPLALPAEQRFRLAPLAVSSPDDPDDVAASPAVAVFVDRARRVRPDFSPGPDEIRVVGEIVRSLDGMPLAIELAAGRLSSLDLGDLHARLDRSLDLLGDTRTVTLRRTIEWSYDLLPEDEQRLFRHLSVFPDGFDLATAEAVATRLGVGADAAGALAHLVDASMVDATLGSPARYRMLDTMRSFGRDRLEAAGEHEAATEQFLQWALDGAADFQRMVDTADERRADELLRREMANLRAAWRLVRDHERGDDAVQLVVALCSSSTWREMTEVWAWALELADDPATEAHPDAASALGIAAGTAWSRGEIDRAARLAARGLELGGPGGWRCRIGLSLVALSRGDLGAAARHAEEAAGQASVPQQGFGIAALARAYDGDLEGAAALNERLIPIASSPTLDGFRHYVAAEIDSLAGRADTAEEHYERAIARSRESGATFLEGIASVGLVTVRAGAGRVAQALDGYRELLEYWARTGGWIQQWTTLRNLARLLRCLGDEETAAFIDAAADHAPDAPAVSGRVTRRSPDASDAESVAAARAEGVAASRSEVLDVARRAIDRHRAEVRDDGGDAGQASLSSPPWTQRA